MLSLCSSVMEEKIKVAIIGFGRMGEFYLEDMIASGRWDVRYICDVSGHSRSLAAIACPSAEIISDEDIIFNDPDIHAVALCALADSRKSQIDKAVSAGKHIISEKPIGMSPEDEWDSVAKVEGSGIVAAVNLYLRNSWYAAAVKEYIESGEIGELAILRICHMTPGLAPGEGHGAEGPAFHDCGMHYADIARYLAGSEFKTMHSQAVRMWDYKDPWWLQCHGTFENGVVYDITQGFVYGQLSKDQTHNSYFDIIGTKGVIRMTHDFRMARVELRGVTRTEVREEKYGGKNIARLCDAVADRIVGVESSGRGVLPTFRDAAVASEFTWKCLEDSGRNDLPSIGNEETLIQIRARRAAMTDGYGLLHKRRAGIIAKK